MAPGLGGTTLDADAVATSVLNDASRTVGQSELAPTALTGNYTFSTFNSSFEGITARALKFFVDYGPGNTTGTTLFFRDANAGDCYVEANLPGFYAKYKGKFAINSAPGAPGITGISPSSGRTGSRVTIRGGGFTGTQRVSFGGVPSTQFSVISDYTLDVTVPPGAISGPVAVRNGKGEFSSPHRSFTVGNGEVVGSTLIRIASPANGATFQAPASFTIRVEINLSREQISTLSLYQNGKEVAIRFSPISEYDYTFSSIGPDTYTFMVGLKSVNGSVAYSAPVTITVNPNAKPPPAPAANAAINVRSNGFTANWDSVSSAIGYRLDVSTSSNFSSYVSGYQNVHAESLLNRNANGLSPGTTYYYRVRAYNDAGNSPDSATITVITSPTTPMAIAASGVTSSTFRANWTAVSSGMGYRLDVSTSSSFGTFVNGYQNLDVGNVNSKSVNGLSASTTYYYRVRAYNGASMSADSVTINVRTTVTDPLIQWQQSFGGIDHDSLRSLLQTSDGGYILAGSSLSGVSGNKTSLNPGGDNYWVVRLDSHGNKLWDKSLGGSYGDLNSIRQTVDGGYILGGVSVSGVSDNKTSPNYGGYDYWVARLDANGNKLWDKSFGGSRDDSLTSLHQTRDGGFIVGGTSSSGASGTKTSGNYGVDFLEDYWVIRLDANGNKLWDKSFGGDGRDFLASVQQTSDGGYILGGNSSSGASGTKTSANTNPVYGDDDFWIVRLDANGNRLWDKSFGGYDSEFLGSLQQISDGGYILGGSSASEVSGSKTSPRHGTSDYWVVRLDPSGNKLWDKSFGGTDLDALKSIQQTSDGGYVLGGYSQSDVSGNKSGIAYGDNDYWVVRLAANGEKLWDQSLGGNNSDVLFSLQPTRDGGYIVGGSSISGVSGNKTFPSHGGFDFWVIKLGTAPPPSPPVANAPSGVTSSGFTAHWSVGNGATGYRLDVSASITFGSYVAGYQDLDVGSVSSRSVTGLRAGTTYYYRVRAYNDVGTTSMEGQIEVTTAKDPSAIKPDLTVTAITLSPTVIEEGKIVTVAADIKNSGAGNAGASRARLSFSPKDDFDDTDDTKFNIVNVSALASGQTQTLRWDVSMPNLGAGTYDFWIVVDVDVDNFLAETDEVNLHKRNESYKGKDAKSSGYGGGGLPDLIFQDAGGFLAGWFMDGGNMVSASSLIPTKVSDVNYQVVGKGDFNNDGEEDLVFQHSDGTIAVWYMDGIELTSGVFLNPANPGDRNWRVVATGDLNRDGKVDLLFQHTDGTLAAWFLDGTKRTSASLFNPSHPGDSQWRVAGVADVNADGNLDLVFQHADGTLAVWYLNGITLIQAALMSPQNPGDKRWRVVSIADRNKDGKPDLLFQHADGSLAIWFMDGVKMSSSRLLNPSKPGGTWKVVAPR